MVETPAETELQGAEQKAELLFAAVRRYGGITREEAICRVGDAAATELINKFVEKRLFVNLTQHAASPGEEVFGLTEKAETLMEEGMTAKRLVALTLSSPSFRQFGKQVKRSFDIQR